MGHSCSQPCKVVLRPPGSAAFLCALLLLSSLGNNTLFHSLVPLFSMLPLNVLRKSAWLRTLGVLVAPVAGGSVHELHELILIHQPFFGALLLREVPRSFRARFRARAAGCGAAPTRGAPELRMLVGIMVGASEVGIICSSSSSPPHPSGEGAPSLREPRPLSVPAWRPSGDSGLEPMFGVPGGEVGGWCVDPAPETVVPPPTVAARAGRTLLGVWTAPPGDRSCQTPPIPGGPAAV